MPGDESCPIDVDLLMVTFEDGHVRDVIHELATQLHATQRELFEMKNGGLTIEELRYEPFKVHAGLS